MPGKEHEAHPLVKMSLMVFRLSGNPLKLREFFERTGDIILQCGTLNQYSSYITKCITFYGSLQIDLCITHFIPSIRFSS